MKLKNIENYRTTLSNKPEGWLSINSDRYDDMFYFYHIKIHDNNTVSYRFEGITLKIINR